MSSQSKDIILLSTADWDNPFWTNKQHVASELARRGYRVLYVESLGLRQPSMNSADGRRLLRRLRKGLQYPRKVGDCIWVWSPVVVPMQQYFLVRMLNKWILYWFCKIITTLSGFHKPLLWTYNPMTLELFHVSPGSRVVYHCVDNIKAQPGMPVDVIEKAENELLQRADHVFVTSEKLYQRAKRINENTYYFPNVADYDHFSKASDGTAGSPDDIVGIRKPVIGFVGAISSYKVDFDLLAFLAKSRPDWSFVLIGKIGEGDPRTDVSRLDFDNIYMLGPKSYGDLPAYIQYFDVAIIPAALNDYTHSMFPMKFFEYLSAGKRVVSTGIDALKNYGQYLLMSDDYNEFLENIEKVLSEGNSVALEERLTLARENTYRSRAEKMLAIIDAASGESRS